MRIFKATAIAVVIIALIAAAAYGFRREHRMRLTIIAWGSDALVEQTQRLGERFAQANELDADQVSVVTPDGDDPGQLSQQIDQAQQQGSVALIASATSFDSAMDPVGCSNYVAMYPDRSAGAAPAFGDSFAATVPNGAWRYFTCDGEGVAAVLDETTDDHLVRRCERSDERGSTICATDRGSTEYRPAASIKVLDADAAKQCESTGECAWEQTAMLQTYASVVQGLSLNRSRTWAAASRAAASSSNTPGSSGAGTSALPGDYLIAFYPSEFTGSSSQSATELNDQFARYLEFQ
ncbi:hypothetical protein JS533_005820 [Bifidobacterium amazonense]|uniref:ABC transporter substrate-binding protein n=1 Tax=Bifidobacterium amazonense TaxID=2809027 RepID=A0ABS9VUN5_9BIFI|nr:hypothetical protein [Bifidobacterium amazonense]MCH9275788.1 hypothetical protein [Bifidobacterium amazonense]